MAFLCSFIMILFNIVTALFGFVFPLLGISTDAVNEAYADILNSIGCM